MHGTLYVVATPIGNLSDFPPRAVQVLSEAALIAVEDTRTSRVLLAHFGIRTPMASCHKFNEAAKLAFFMNTLRGGKDVALISDAGTPCLSDPGHRLVAQAAAEGFTVVGVPGACAAITAVAVSGFDAASFLFIGFLPRTKAAVIEKLAPLAPTISAAPLLVFYESPRRMAATLALLAEQYPQSRVCLCNDLTKKFERIYRGSPAEVLMALSDNPHAEKGEYTCVVECGHKPSAMTGDNSNGSGRNDEGNGEGSNGNNGQDDALSLEAQLADYMAKTGGTLKDAVQALAATAETGVNVGIRNRRRTGHKKKEIYAASLRLKAWFATDE